jgi:hypothetical protein
MAFDLALKRGLAVGDSGGKPPDANAAVHGIVTLVSAEGIRAAAAEGRPLLENGPPGATAGSWQGHLLQRSEQ